MGILTKEQLQHLAVRELQEIMMGLEWLRKSGVTLPTSTPNEHMLVSVITELKALIAEEYQPIVVKFLTTYSKMTETEDEYSEM